MDTAHERFRPWEARYQVEWFQGLDSLFVRYDFIKFSFYLSLTEFYLCWLLTACLFGHASRDMDITLSVAYLSTAYGTDVMFMRCLMGQVGVYSMQEK